MGNQRLIGRVQVNAPHLGPLQCQLHSEPQHLGRSKLFDLRPCARLSLLFCSLCFCTIPLCHYAILLHMLQLPHVQSPGGQMRSSERRAISWDASSETGVWQKEKK